MSEEEKQKLLEKAKEFSCNAFVPYSLVPCGACVLTEENILIGGCNVENCDLSCSFCAASVAVLKAVSEGYNKIKAVAVYSAGKTLPYLSGSARQIIHQFGKNAEIIIANNEKCETFNIFEMLPFAYEGEEE